MNAASIISKVWGFCTTLRDDGVGYGDYLEQLTYLIFLKMAAEYAQPPYKHDIGIPAGYGWQSLTARRGAELEAHYIESLRKLGTRPGTHGKIFTKAQDKIQDPAKLYHLITMVDDENWVMMGADVKGDIYEGLLEKNAEDTKSGAGQYFTPRALIRAMVECVRPAPGRTIADPACGTGGFFLGAYDFITHAGNYQLDKAQKANVIFFDNRVASPSPWTREVWYYDYRTNVHHTLKKKPLRFPDLTDFIQCYNPQARHERQPTWAPDTNPDGRWRRFSYEELVARDKTSLDVFWLKDKSLTDLDNLPEPDDLAAEIIENLEAGLTSFRAVLSRLGTTG